MSDVVPAYADQLMAFPKLCNVTLTWSERDNHAGLLLATAQPEDNTGAILPGMTLQLVVKRPLVVDRCLYELGLFQLDHGMRRRDYQLNVTPADKRSHNGPNGPLYGPHEPARPLRKAKHRNAKHGGCLISTSATKCCPSMTRISRAAAWM